MGGFSTSNSRMVATRASQLGRASAHGGVCSPIRTGWGTGLPERTPTRLPGLFDHALELARTDAEVDRLPSLEQWSVRAGLVAVEAALDRCPECGGRLLVGAKVARCSGCGWAGRVVRRLP